VFHRDAFTVVAPPIKIDQWDLAPFAWPPSELDHITGKTGHTITVRRPAALSGARRRVGARGDVGARHQQHAKPQPVSGPLLRQNS